MIAELIRTPNQYFTDRIKYPHLRTQAIIVALAGLLTHGWRLGTMQNLGASSTYIEDVLIILTFAGILEFFFWWLALTAVMHLVANALGGDSSYGRLLRLVGYSFLPLLLSGAVWSAGRYIAIQGVTNPPEPPISSSFQYRYESYSRFLDQAAGDPLLLGSLVLGSVFVLAAGYLWLQAVSVAADIDTNSAGIAAGIATVIFLARVFVPVV